MATKSLFLLFFPRRAFSWDDLNDDDNPSIFSWITQSLVNYFPSLSDLFSAPEEPCEITDVAVYCAHDVINYPFEYLKLLLRYLYALAVFIFSTAETFDEVIDYLEPAERYSIRDTVTALAGYQKTLTWDLNPFHWIGKILDIITVFVVGESNSTSFLSFMGSFLILMLTAFVLLGYRFKRRCGNKHGYTNEMIVRWCNPKFDSRVKWADGGVEETREQDLSMKTELGSSSSSEFPMDSVSDDESVASSAVQNSAVSEPQANFSSEATDVLMQDVTSDDSETSIQRRIDMKFKKF